MTGPTHVVIADDHPMFLAGLRAVLAPSTEVDVIGEAQDGEQLLTLVDQAQPDVVLTDLAMPRLDGITAIRHIHTHHPDVAILVLTMHDDDEAVFGALRAGALGYLLKGAEQEEIVRAIQSVASGHAVYGPAVAHRIVTFYTRAADRYAAQVFPELTARERQVLDLVAAGRGNHDIATCLVLSEKTVRNNITTILTKLQVHDRAAAVAKARDAGMGSTSHHPPPPSTAPPRVARR